MPDANFWGVFLVNLPLTAVVLIALFKSWAYLKPHVEAITAAHAKEVASLQEQLKFREELRQSCLKENKEKNETIEEFKTTIASLSSVIERSVVISEELIDDLSRQREGPDSVKQRRRKHLERSSGSPSEDN